MTTNNDIAGLRGLARKWRDSSENERIGAVAYAIRTCADELDPIGTALLDRLERAEAVVTLMRDVWPALDAYELGGRRSYHKDGALHWEVTPQFYRAQELRKRVESTLAAYDQATKGAARE